jgi:hypothetical protein
MSASDLAHGRELWAEQSVFTVLLPIAFREHGG